MASDFLSQYVELLHKEIESRISVLENKEFQSLAEVNQVQGQLRAYRNSLKLLRAIPEKD